MSTHLRTSDCRETVELLPWLLNGSLEATERSAFREHLAGCADCRRELEMTAQAWEITTQHIPSLVLAEYAQGLQPSEMTTENTENTENIERHLAMCPSCRQEFEWAASDRVLDFASARFRQTPIRSTRTDADIRRRVSQWRHAALAAGIIAVLSSASLIWTLLSSRSGDPASEIVIAAAPATETSREAPFAAQRLPHGREKLTMSLFSNGFEEGSIVWSASQ